MGLTNQVISSFHNDSGVAFVRGTIFRAVTGVSRASTASAGALSTLVGTIGCANNPTSPGGVFNGVVGGEAPCLLVAGLTPVAGQVVYVSGTAGKGTTAAPTLALPIGTITDASRYSIDGTVIVNLDLALVVNGGGGSDPLWDPSLVRYYFLDNENGNDNNVGYIDAAALTVFTPAQTSVVALKTSEELRNRVPRSGGSRVCVVLAKPRSDAGNYVNKAGANDYLDVNYDGYRMIFFRGSDLTNSTNDQVDLGGVIDVAGPNADGSWTSTGTAGFTITNGAGVLPAEDSITGRKFQFKGNVTAALRTQGNMCMARLGNTTLDVVNSSNVPANGDQYFLMTPGVKFTTLVGPTGRTNTQNSRQRGVTIAGLRFTTSTSIVWPVSPTPVFLRFDGTLSWVAAEQQTFTTNYTVENLTTNRTINCNFDVYGNNSSMSGSGTNLFGLCVAFHGASFITAGSFGGFYSLGLVTLQAAAGPVGVANNVASAIGAGGSGIRPARLIAGMTVNGATRVDGIDLSASSVGITVTGRSEVSFYNVTGNPTAAPVIDVSACIMSRFYIDSTVTSTKATDLQMAGSITATFASLVTAAQMDSVYNRAQGTSAQNLRSSFLKFSGAHAGGAGAVTSYLADPGQVAAGALAVAPNYPVQASCRLRNLIVKASANTLAADLTAEIYVSGVASGLKVTVTAGSVATFNDQANEALVPAGQLIDLRLDSNAAGGGNTALLSATVECY